MVGVPGKYKGCETCRLRRVKCDNERPFCKKCLDSGRQCAGYERETVFIIGTLDDGGRCSSHPPRVIKSRKAKGSSPRAGSPRVNSPKSSSPKPGPSKEKAPERVQSDPTTLVAVEPLRPAWDDLISVSDRDSFHQVQLAALRTSLQSLNRETDGVRDASFRVTGFETYAPADLHPPPMEEEFTIHAQCMVHLNQPSDNPTASIEAAVTDSICLYLYEHNASLRYDSLPPWSGSASQSDPVKRLGPEAFKGFPSHHFFVRVYRPTAISAALINRQNTFLSGPQWLTVPWETYPKSWTDRLFDTILLLPSLLSRCDRLLPYNPTMARRLMAQDLLVNCLSVERLLDDWHVAVNPGCVDLTQPLAFWMEAPVDAHAHIPFAEAFAFQNSVAAVTFIYYWTSLIVFYQCIERVHSVIFQPVVDAFPQIYPDLPPNLHIDVSKYSMEKVRDLAANVCRGLDFALNSTVQPDLLVAPLFIIEQLYKEVNATYGDAALELIWCDGFRMRLAAKGQDLVEVIQTRSWIDLGEY